MNPTGEIQPCLFVYRLSVTAFAPELNSGSKAKGIIWSVKLKILLPGSLQKMFANLRFDPAPLIMYVWILSAGEVKRMK